MAFNEFICREKRVRFPKKKSKPGDEVPTTSANVPQVAEDESEEAKVVAKAKSARRNQNKAGLTIDENGDLLDVVAHSEMHYKVFSIALFFLLVFFIILCFCIIFLRLILIYQSSILF